MRYGGVASLAVLALIALPAEAQPTRPAARIGVLSEAYAANHPTVEGLKAGLRELGLGEGRDVAFDIRFTEGNPDATRAAAATLAGAGVGLIVTVGEGPTRAARAAAGNVPIVFTLVGDPVAAGLVKTLAHPGGNLTGVSSLATDLTPKRLEALRTVSPGIRRVVAIHHGGDPSSVAAIVKAKGEAARLRLPLEARPVVTPEEVPPALRDVRPGDALLAPESDALDIPAAILAKSLASRIPAVFATALWVGHGGLLSYGPDYYAQGVQAAELVARLLRGARPEDVPVEGAEKIELAVNLKTADLFRIAVPQKILLRADTFRR